MKAENDCNMLNLFDIKNIGRAGNDMSIFVKLDCEKCCIMHLIYAYSTILSSFPLLYKVMTIH